MERRQEARRGRGGEERKRREREEEETEEEKGWSRETRTQSPLIRHMIPDLWRG